MSLAKSRSPSLPNASSDGVALAGFALREIPEEILRGTSEWMATQFTPDQIADPAMSGFLANPDGDDFPNLFEYAFNLDPRSTDDPGLLIATANGDTATVRYEWDRSKYDVYDTVEISSDMVTWTSVPRQVVGTSGTMETVEVTFPWSSTIFTRLSIRPN